LIVGTQKNIGKRYWLYASDDAKRIRSGLFTGRFATKGNATVMEKDGMPSRHRKTALPQAMETPFTFSTG
jgi:hypothetical protein